MPVLIPVLMPRCQWWDFQMAYYTEIEYKCVNVYIKNKTVVGDWIIVSKGMLHFKYVHKE